MRLRFAMRADQQPALRIAIAADHIADAVDDRVKPGLGEFFGQPLPRGDVLGRIGRPVHPGLVAAEFGEPLQIGEDPRAIGSRHIRSPATRSPSLFYCRNPAEARYPRRKGGPLTSSCVRVPPACRLRGTACPSGCDGRAETASPPRICAGSICALAGTAEIARTPNAAAAKARVASFIYNL